MGIMISDPYSGQEDGLMYQMTWNEIMALQFCDPGQGLFALQKVQSWLHIYLDPRISTMSHNLSQLQGR